jgi:hypothetical protein
MLEKDIIIAYDNYIVEKHIIQPIVQYNTLHFDKQLVDNKAK